MTRRTRSGRKLACLLALTVSPAAGFASEIGPGATIPELDELKKFLSQGEIDKLTNYNATQYHLSPSSTFNKLTFWGTALDNRYGKPSNVGAETIDELARFVTQPSP